MTLDDLKQTVSSDYNDVSFIFRGKSAGIASEVYDYVPRFLVWYGDKTEEHDNIDDILTASIFDGKSMVDIVDSVNIQID